MSCQRYPSHCVAALAVMLLVGAPAGPGAKTVDHRPNVVLIMTDDMGYGDLGLHGNPQIRTPNLDRLGREGIQLTRFHVSPVCSPTRASLMTGRYNYRTGVVDTYLGRSMMHPDERTLPELLRAAGYRTGIFGKWHLGDCYPLRPIDRGFEEALVCTGGGIGQPSDPPGNRYFDPILRHNGRAERRSGYCTDLFTSAAIEFVEKNRRRPFFAYLATNAPHEPLQVDEALVEPYRKARVDERTARIYAMVENIDRNVGRLLARLRELDLERDTLVVFLTDNGPQGARYNAGTRGLKGSVYEGGIRVPGFVRWPAALPGGRSVDRIAAHVDVLPTILDACRVPVPTELRLDGRSLLPLLHGATTDWPARTLYFQWHRGDQPEAFRACAALGDRFKLVDGRELYDLAADPTERKNVAAEHPEVVAEMRRGYLAWFRDVSSTRGYDPPRIPLGWSKREPVLLTRQDWRGPRAGWTPDSLGFWEVCVERPGPYRVTLTVPRQTHPAEVTLRLGSALESRPIPEGATTVTLDGVRLPAGPGRLEAWVRLPGDPAGAERGVDYVEVLPAGAKR